MTNHVSNLDPPIQIPLIPKRTSVMVKKELFKVPILGRAMRMGSLVPVDRGNRDAGIEAVRAAKAVIDQGLNMTIYVEGKRSFDGKLLPFKKGPFYLAVECGVPVIPVTIVGTHYTMPKARFAIKPGLVKVIFHPPIEPKDFGSRDCLMEKVRSRDRQRPARRISPTRVGAYRRQRTARRTSICLGIPLRPQCPCPLVVILSFSSRVPPARSPAIAEESPNTSATICDRPQAPR